MRVLNKIVHRWKFHCLFLLFLSSLLTTGCPNQPGLSEEDTSIILTKYIDEFSYKKWHVEQNINKDTASSQEIALIDSIINQLERSGQLKDSRESMIHYVEKHKANFNAQNQNVDSFLIANFELFKVNKLSPVQELHFIDKFIDLIYWDTWRCNMSVNTLVKYIPGDTILLYEDSHYDIPIRVEYLGDNCGLTILSNSLQRGSESHISFETANKENGCQTIYYSCQVRDDVTGAIQTFRDSLVIKLLEKKEWKLNR